MKGLLLIAGSLEALAATALGSWWLFADTFSVEVGPVLSTVLMSLIASIFAAVTSWLAYKRTDESTQQGKEIKETIQEVAKKTIKKLDTQGETIDVIHHLSNGVLGKTMWSNRNLSRWRADQNPDNAQYAAEADEADKQYQEHQENEAKAAAAKKAKPMEVVVVQSDDSPVPVQDVKKPEESH